jgi:hypothetical protein
MNITLTAKGLDYELSLDDSLKTKTANILMLGITPENIDDLLAQVKATVINNIPAKPTTIS